jgi:hypothetical protein
MQIAVRFRRKPGHDLFEPALVEIGLNDVTNEIAPRLGRYRFCRHHLFLFGKSVNLLPNSHDLAKPS